MSQEKIKTLWKTADGSARQCTCCQKVVIDYKNIIIPLKIENFISFQDYVAHLCGKLQDQHLTANPVRVRLQFQDVIVLLTGEELQALNDLLWHTEIELKRQALERYFQADASLEAALAELE